MSKQKTALNLQTLRRVLTYVKPYRTHVLVSLLCASVSAAAALLIPIFSGNAIDCMIGVGAVDMAGVTKWALLIALSAILAAIAQQFLATSNNRIAYCVSRDIRNETNRKLQRLPLSYLDAHPAGDVVSRVIADVDAFSDGLLMGFTQLFTGVVTICGTLGIMLALNFSIALLVVVLTPLSLFVAAFIAKRTHRYFTEQAKVRGEQTAMINELIEGQKVVQSFGHEDESLAEFDEVNERLGKVSLNATFFSSLVNPSTRLVNNIIYAAVGLVCALFAIADNPSMTIGGMSVFLSYASQYAKPFNEISGVVTELQNALACVRRIFTLLDEPDRLPDAADASDLDAQGNVSLTDVSFRYVPDRPLIEDFSLNVKPGQRIAIVGPTGCGKTTLINLLMRFYDVNEGSIRVDGVDIRDIKRRELRRNIGMVLQDTWLKAGTIRENIAYGKPDNRGNHRCRQGRPCPFLHPPTARGLRHRHHRERRQPLRRTEAAAVHRPRDADAAAHADPGRGHLLHRHPHGAAHPVRVREDDAGQNVLHRGAPPVHHPRGRRDPRHARRPHCRAGRS